MTDGAGTETRTYDNLDRLKTGTRGSDTFAYAYDPVGNVTQRTYPGQTPIDYTYDGLDRMIAISNAGATSFGYDLASNQTSATPWNGQVETRVYDRIGRLTEVKTEKAGVTLDRFVSTLDPVGNPTQIVRTGALSETRTYTYDANDRLTEVCNQAGGCPGATDPYERWTYDKVGNRLTSQRPDQSLTYNYNALDQVTSIGFASWTYDQNGNHTSRGDKTHTYDQANRLKTATIPPTTTTYSYDGDGARLQASTGPGASEKTNFLRDVNQGLPQLALERDGANALLRRYTYGVRLNSMVAGSTTSFYHYDLLGSVASITGGAGATRWTYSYQPFGGSTQQQGAGTQPANFMRFTGQYLDPTGFYHLRARQYESTWGRFLQPDPVDRGNGSAHLSPYAYADCRPTVLVDPSGMVSRPSKTGIEAAEFGASAIQSRVVSVFLTNSPKHPCQLSIPLTFQRGREKHLQVSAIVNDPLGSLTSFFGRVRLTRTGGERVERHFFRVSESGPGWSPYTYREKGVSILYFWPRPAQPMKAIDPAADNTNIRVRVTAQHTWRGRLIDCIYENE